MILRLKGVITHDHDTKLPREDGEGAAVGWGTRPSPKAKTHEEYLGDAPTHGRGNKTNLRKDPTPAFGWGTDLTPRKSPTSDDVGGGVDQERCIPISGQTGVKLEAACTRYLGDNLDTGAIHLS